MLLPGGHGCLGMRLELLVDDPCILHIPFSSLLKARFQRMYMPTRNNAIDEAMIPFKGRSGVKQYMPKKPIKRGIKVWVRADSENGFFCDFDVYVGASASPEKGLGARVVKKLTRSLVGKNYHVYCDNFFSGVDLFADLQTEGIYACGTLRSNRLHFPDNMKSVAKKGLKNRGDSITQQAGNLVVTVWQDNKPVSILSTNAQATPQHTVQRRQKDGSRNEVTCPEAIVLYNKYMGGVDKGDQNRGYYQVRLKSRKMYKYVFWFLFDVTIVNTFILKQFAPGSGRRRQLLKAFRVQLARELIGDYCGRKQPGRPRVLPPATTSEIRQPPQHFPRKATKGRCRKCHAHYTTWYCAECGLRFCHTGTDTDCFMAHHMDNQLY